MSEQIDWSKAPEGCIGAFTSKPDFRSAGFSSFFVITKRYSDYGAQAGCSGQDSEGKEYHVFEKYWDYHEKPASWSGEGLPPVGVVCEMHHESWQPNNWPKVTVRYASAEYFITTDDAGEQHWHAHSVKFRPIRTPEQIARDERDESVISVFRLIKENGWDIQSDDADYLYFLYDSGLLKKAS